MGLGPTFHLLARESSPVQPEASLTWPRRNPCGGVPPRPGSHAGQLDAEADTAPTSPEALAGSGCRCVLFRLSRASSRPTRSPSAPTDAFQPAPSQPPSARARRSDASSTGPQRSARPPRNRRPGQPPLAPGSARPDPVYLHWRVAAPAVSLHTTASTATSLHNNAPQGAR